MAKYKAKREKTYISNMSCNSWIHHIIRDLGELNWLVTLWSSSSEHAIVEIVLTFAILFGLRSPSIASNFSFLSILGCFYMVFDECFYKVDFLDLWLKNLAAIPFELFYCETCCYGCYLSCSTHGCCTYSL